MLGQMALMRRWVSVAAAVVVGAAVAGCGSGVAEGDRVACERYVGAHAVFDAAVGDVTAVTERGESVSQGLAAAWTAARDAGVVSVGDALAVAEDPGLVVALREADAVKAAFGGGAGAGAAAVYATARQRVEVRCAELLGE